MTGESSPWDAFWQFVDDGSIRIPVCSACDEPNWYPVETCRQCAATSFTWVPLSGRARVYVAMLVHRDFQGQEWPLPYQVALVSPVEYDTVRVLATAPPTLNLSVDDEVHIEPASGPRGEPVVAVSVGDGGSTS